MGLFDELRGLFKIRPRAYSRPRGKRPYRRLDRRLGKKAYVNYNKKAKFTLRADKELIADFKRLCESKGVFVNEVFEVYMRNALLKNSLDKIRVRLVRSKTAVRG